ncbi:rhodanese-like domain-containing protein [Novipirellula artificiosorum]|uniref:Rhodanese domain-containing protein n=1 Tax=Novipirellula artificiosorum TaxID=2528016 RepID=A0A5C6D6H1_9BACT|nr:hypothetical protein [Novipirellula artificiosorum]TWU31307.1 hypothetical protein Poly41_61760 [Novipirellula artificiosorum]
MPENIPSVAKAKQTVLGLYVTAQEAYAIWQADPDNVKILDVRTPEEFLFVGHPPMAWREMETEIQIVRLRAAGKTRAARGQKKLTPERMILPKSPLST